ncbi:double-strand break repair protein AddB [Alphaproteobacteria bacterium LSUCC0684]
MTSQPGFIHNIEAGEPFADDLVRGVLELAKGPEDLADSFILLPNRRLANAVRGAFLRQASGKAMLLPRLMPIGDVDTDAEELIISGWDRDDLPPVIDPLERQLHLARLIPKGDLALADHMALARALGEFLDQAQTAGCSFDRLNTLAEDEYASHWQRVLAVLRIVTEYWPLKLEQLNRSDPAAWRNAAILARAEAWRKKAPPGLVIIAGSTGSIPATQELMRAVLELERGHVVLPGLDMDMPEEDWQALLGEDETTICHPQYPLARLLSTLGVDRGKVLRWPKPTGDDRGSARKARQVLLREAMRPAEQAGAWRKIPLNRKIGVASLEGLSRIDCYDRREEAEVIALAMREVLETPGRTATLITADRALARMVSGELVRWNIHISDSAGIKLGDTNEAQFLRLIAEAWTGGFAPSALLAMGFHRLASAGLGRVKFRQRLRQLELLVLRGQRIPGGLKGIAEAAGRVSPDLGRFVEEALITPLKPLSKFTLGVEVPLSRLTDALGQAAELLAADPDEPLRPWQGQAGVRLARFLHRLTVSGDKTNLTPEDLPSVLTQLMAGETVYPEEVGHPRLSILGAVEARMQTADLVILGGMNEGTFPSHPPPDPWMSNAMRASFGLPPATWRIGLAAHDVMMALARPEVLITRAEREDGSPTEVSRWLRRLEAVLDVAGLNWPEPPAYREIVRRLHVQSGPLRPYTCPAPRVSAALRPRQYSATEIDMLQRDPYAIYAKRILRLKPLDPLDQLPTVADRGNLVHEALKVFIDQFGKGRFPADSYDRLISIGEEAFKAYRGDPWVKTFWFSQFRNIAAWWIEQEITAPEMRQRSFAERRGEIRITLPDGEIILTAKADRLDLLADNRLVVIDYKTGSIPSRSNVARNQALQLPVEAVIAARGGFPEIPAPCLVERIEYWQLKGRRSDRGKIIDVTPEDDWITRAEEHITDLVRRFALDEEPYLSEPDPGQANPYSPYKHLARVREWSRLSPDSDASPGEGDDR